MLIIYEFLSLSSIISAVKQKDNHIKSIILFYSISRKFCCSVSLWEREKDLNFRPLGYEPNELPAAPSRDILSSLYSCSGVQLANWTILALEFHMIFVHISVISFTIIQ